MPDQSFRSGRGGWDGQRHDRANSSEAQDNPTRGILVEDLAKVEVGVLMGELENDLGDRENRTEKQRWQAHHHHHEGAFSADPRGEQQLGPVDESKPQIALYTRKTVVAGFFGSAEFGGRKRVGHKHRPGNTRDRVGRQSFFS